MLTPPRIKLNQVNNSDKRHGTCLCWLHAAEMLKTFNIIKMSARKDLFCTIEELENRNKEGFVSVWVRACVCVCV